MIVVVLIVFLFAVGCVRQYRARRAQRHIARAAELLLWRRVLEVADAARADDYDT